MQNEYTNHSNNLMKELQIVSNDNLMLRAEIKERMREYEKTRIAFMELLEVHLKLRENSGLGQFNKDHKYDWIEKAGLNDPYKW